MTHGRIGHFLAESNWNKCLRLKNLYWKLKTQTLYRLAFKNIGRKTVILKPMVIVSPDCIEIGEGVSIRDGVRLEAYRDRYGRIPRLTIGSGTFIEQNVQIICHSRISIGKNVAIAGGCAVVDVTHPFRDLHDNLPLAARIVDEDSFVEIGEGAFLGYGVVVLPNVRIGKFAVIGANAVVTKDVPDFGVASGVPAVLREVFHQDLGERGEARMI